MNNSIISKNCVIGKNVTIKDGSIIGENVIIEEDVYIDYGCIIKDNVHIKRGTFVGARCILGEYLVDFFDDMKNKNHPLIIGQNSLIRSETIIYGENIIGDNFQTGHRVTIREKSDIGNNVRIGTLSDIQGHCKIGNYINIHSNVHIGQKSIIKDYVWIFPYVVLTNDPTPPSEQLLGVTVESFAVIATMSVILPGVHIYEDALVAAGATVNKDVPKEVVVAGSPAKPICKVSDIKNKISGEKVYPWRYTFDRGMPWNNVGYEQWAKNNPYM
ncbi:acetyltransferase-like isoleucine patch superfamily enzyme [Clostridium saccharoperbutylacetonicum]|uniref:UDP-3-O-[3-hydroxymyristoyl] glucosamine N-acyltransferase n=1 Tax=Clostridium saccharoperbutylacetonicum N1-4(HMT) TaxID=931276 RepID=M1MSP9_9CLOT|nr:N-acetyltransferase [Clostridium saccharoperbutylacetonicum]AGF59163.1 UDP-3-O-[3-hydroxymyristoyl] glucosamine N-acyltransferase [Clostridium saccharoperbutylacetonicum N1-4(HMT)]NRT60050.1 acetyltransferase-like isoleucine patch superfamily enzyme [Clostridium saccharoperbutylacetonicum]NSB23362.1 acetyltransferase-like isoleucine patch superfamily enzyme [Clostridium saccharoperbutylacetonicum]NSB42732.1 acetyltransferase-like isoleucine patch superfamily enzyme [Clostridium saccharoperbu